MSVRNMDECMETEKHLVDRRDSMRTATALTLVAIVLTACVQAAPAAVEAAGAQGGSLSSIEERARR